MSHHFPSTSDRIGLGTLQFTKTDGYGLVANIGEQIDILKAGIAHGLRYIDTAWYYGPNSVNRLLARALSPYPDDLIIVAKIGNTRGSDFSYAPSVSVRSLRHACDRTLRTLNIDSIPLLLLRWRADLDQDQTFDGAWHTMLALREAGKADRVGLSNVSLSNILRARQRGPIHAVSNAYSLSDRSDDYIVNYCAANDITFLAYYPLFRGSLAHNDACFRVARDIGATPTQVALAWLLARSPVIVPIPGTSRLPHFLENVRASEFVLSDTQYRSLTR